jgi:eukaryotic-like serine/threonine-protein kinase
MSDSAPAIGQVIAGKYRVERVLGEGGMGVVVAAQHLQLNQTVALKFLLKELSSKPDAARRFLREAQALARLKSPHVGRVMDVGTLEHGEPFLVMEYLDGSDLGAVLRQRGPLPVEEAVAHLLQVGEAVAEAHANGIVHRDLKPSNLFLTRGHDGVPSIKVLDFGISKATLDGADPATQETSTGALVGSPLYMSPEQIRDAKRVDARSDIWALGVILHELLTGKPPFWGESLISTLAAVAADPAPPIRELRADVPPQIEAAILRCLEKDPQKRLASVVELSQAIAAFGPADAQAYVLRTARLSPAKPEAGSAALSSPGDPALDATVASSRALDELAAFTRTQSKAKSSRLAFALAGGATTAALAALLGIQSSARQPTAPSSVATPARAPTAASPSTAVGTSSAEAQTSAGAAPERTFTTATPAPSASARPAPRRGDAAVRPTPSVPPTPSVRPTPPINPEDDGTQDRK